jgi:hypothetical protein
MSAAEVKERVDTALHEAVHLLAAILRHAYVRRVVVHPARRAKRTGEAGRFDADERRSCDGALISYVGYAWEEAHGDVALATSDLRDGNRRADEAGQSREDVLNEAREFVRFGEGAIRVVAASILAVMPVSGILESRKLQKLIDWFRPVFPEHANTRHA